MFRFGSLKMMVGEAGSLRLAGGSRRSSQIDGGGGGGYGGGPTSRHPRVSSAGQEHTHHKHSSFHPSPTSGYQTHQVRDEGLPIFFTTLRFSAKFKQAVFRKI